jgi:transposase-like protein
VRQIKTPSRECDHVVRYGDNLGGVFTLATRVSYPVELKMKAIEMRLAGVPVKEVLEQLNIRNKTQLETWIRWYRAGETHRLEQPVGKQYSFGKGPEYASELEKLKAEVRFLNQQLDVLKKYKELERRCRQRSSSHGWNPFEEK